MVHSHSSVPPLMSPWLQCDGKRISEGARSLALAWASLRSPALLVDVMVMIGAEGRDDGQARKEGQGNRCVPGDSG
jgi:hypothetical protein